MLLRRPYYRENFKVDQPYNSLLLISPYCYRNCPNCHNSYLKTNRISNLSVEFLSNVYKNNRYINGITIGGLEPLYNTFEWWDEIQDLVDTCRIENVCIYTSFDDLGSVKIKTKNLYLKTGVYIHNDQPITYILDKWSITLASSNQKFVRLN